MSSNLLRFVLASAVVFAPSLAVCSSLQDWEFNINGTSYLASNGATLSQVPGLNATGFDSNTGQGTLQIIFNPGSAGTYNVDAWIFNALSTPFYNEYGTVNGSPVAGQSWQIDVPDYDSDSNHTGTIIANTAAAALDNTNHVPGTTDDFLGDCSSGATCNDATSLAMGFKFTLTSTQEEVITLLLGPNNPGGFSLEQIHPVDGANATATDMFFSGTAVTEPSGVKPPPVVPEPATLGLMGAGLVAAAFTQRRRWLRK